MPAFPVKEVIKMEVLIAALIAGVIGFALVFAGQKFHVEAAAA